jgi:hypothetical protein
VGYLTKSAINQIKDYDTRNMLEGVYNELDALHQAQGTSFLTPVNNQQKAASAAPSAPSLSVSGANGSFTWTITPPSQSINKSLFYELSYSPLTNFSASVTTLPPTNATTGVIPSPGMTAYFRVRASYDQKNWSSYAYS